MAEVEFSSEMDVRLVQNVGSDSTVVSAARVSTSGEDTVENFNVAEGAGLINFLIANRHGSVLEHNLMTFYISAPIFVFREFHRHRIGWSYNEISGRYSELPAKFYLPADDRNIKQIGKTGHYEFVPGTDDEFRVTYHSHKEIALASYVAYKHLLEDGIAKEVARMSLPVNIYSSMYATCNARSLMAFLSLRTKREDSKFPSYPQREIEMVAEKMEEEFAKLFPITYEAFNRNGRVCP
jgi:thymidylate synthase (FAD)